MFATFFGVGWATMSAQVIDSQRRKSRSSISAPAGERACSSRRTLSRQWRVGPEHGHGASPRERALRRDGDVVDVLRAGESLGIDQKLTSNNGKYTLIMQGDGNLVLYTESNTPVWATRTQGSGAVRASLQDDGNLVLYTKEVERWLRRDAAHAVWASQTRGENVRLVLQDDRNLVVYTSDGRALWAAGTALAGGAETPVTEVPAAPTAAPAAPTEAPAAPTEAPAKRIYTVVSGDTLWAIAERFYGDGSKYPKIASANGIANPDLIMVGQNLTIPE
jgi:LysM domain